MDIKNLFSNLPVKSLPMMKAVILLLSGILLSASLSAQLLNVTPSFPKDTSAVSIIMDATKGNQGLNNYANPNDVYVHVGVITNLSTGPSDWKYVKFTWGSTDAAAKATSLGNNKYQYIINNIRTFLAVPASETILRLSILFRNGNGATVQRNADGGDMYVRIYDASFAGKYILPPFEPKYNAVPEPINKSIGDSIRVSWLTNNLADIKLFFNGTQVNGVLSSNAILDSIPILTSGNQQLVARATVGVTTISDTINFFVSPSVSVLPLPAGVKDGINYEPGDTSAILVLFAPGKAKVSVLGDFNNWTEGTDYQMNKTPDGQRFWVRVKGLTPGTEYSFQYLVNNSIKIAEPYTTKVLDPANDPFITAITYPNLKAYPTGKTIGIVSLLQTAKPAYVWQAAGYTRPDKRSLVIYELLVRDFVNQHDWNAVKDSINYLKTLGITAVEFMPFNEFEGNVSWGYNPSFYLAPDKYYGPENKLKELIDEFHKNGIAVIMDIALNHSFGQSPLVQLYFDAANSRPSVDNPWFNPTARHAFNVGYDMNHESAATKYFFSRVVEHWLTEYKLDGFRFDLSKGFTQVNTCDGTGNNCNVTAWGNYDASRVAIWKRYYDTLQLKSPGSYAILEHFADNIEEKELSDYGMMLWGNMNFNFSEAAMGFVSNSNLSGALFTSRGWNQPALIGYSESHDEERLMYKNLNFGNSGSGYSTRNTPTALARNEMGASFLLMMPGPKMLWQFGEIGYDYSINYCQNGTINNNCRLDPKPIRWDYLQDVNRKHLYDVHTGLLKLRREPLFKNGFVTNRVESSLASAFKWLKLTTDTSNILVVGNFDVTATSGSVTFQNAGTWYDYFSGNTITATGAAQNISLQAGEYHVYVNRNVTFPLSNAPTPVIELPYNGKKIRLSVYPNPIRQQATIEYEVPESGNVQIRLVNMTGQQVAVIYNGFQPKGVHKVATSNLTGLGKLAKGTYFLQMEFNQKKLVQKLVLDF